MTRAGRAAPPTVSLFTPGAAGFILIGAALLLWPLLLTGGHPFLAVDSSVYADQGERIWSFVSEWAGRDAPVATSGTEAASGDVIQALRSETGDADTVRSVPYAAFIGALLPLGPVAALYAQAVLVMTTLCAVSLLLAPQRQHAVLAAALALSLITGPAATMASYLMPDIFGAVVVLFAIAIMLGLDRISRASRIVLFAIVVLAVTFHYGNVPLALGLFCVAALLRTGRRQVARVLIGVAGGTVLLAVGLNVAIGIVGFDTTSVAPGRAPIVLARSIEDGPARWVLEDDCASDAPRYALCEYWGTDIPGNVGAALWDDGGMNDAPPELYARIRAEEVALLTEAVRTYPLQQVGAFASNALDQALVIWPRYANPAEFVRHPDGRRTHGAVDDTAFETLRPALDTLHEVGYAIGVAGLMWIVLVTRDATARRVAIVVLVGLALNAAIFGGLSAPVPRYQARVAWLALTVFVLLLARLIAQRGADSGDLPSG
jgi:hypothetical protein